MAFVTLEQIKNRSAELSPGGQVAFKDKSGRVRIGTVRIKEVRCGKKNCTKCPHKKYAYAQYRAGKKVSEKYLGVAR